MSRLSISALFLSTVLFTGFLFAPAVARAAACHGEFRGCRCNCDAPPATYLLEDLSLDPANPEPACATGCAAACGASPVHSSYAVPCDSGDTCTAPATSCGGGLSCVSGVCGLTPAPAPTPAPTTPPVPPAGTTPPGSSPIPSETSASGDVGAPIPTGGEPVPGTPGAICRASPECPDGFLCAPAVTPGTPRRCVRPDEGGTCSDATGCEAGTVCQGGRCICPASGCPEPQTANQGTIEQVEGHITAPVLAVPIPGLAAFQNPTVQGSDGQAYLDIPFLAQYISAVYTYALGIIVTIATVMVVIGGLKWMLARGDSGKVSEAKETLSRAVIGVLLALGSYAILSLLNPELVNLRALRIQLIMRDEVDEELMDTRAETFDAVATGGGTVGRSSGGGGYQSCRDTPARSSGCPVSLSQPVTCTNPREPRTREFLAAIVGACPHGREGVVCAANAAAHCGVHMGSCLNTAQTLIRAVGARIRGRPGQEVNAGLLRPAQDIGNACRAAGGSEADCRQRAKTAAAAAIRAAKPGWPDNWIRDLRPGDMIRVYNARRGGVGQHSAVIISVSGDRASVVQASYGHYVTTGSMCIKPNCGGILTKTYITE